MSKRSNIFLVGDILESSKRILEYTLDKTFDQFVIDNKTIDAVIRNFEIIGEAAGRLSDDFKDKNEDIDWHRIRGFRNRIVHDYMGIDYSIVWHIIQNFLPDLINSLNSLK